MKRMIIFSVALLFGGTLIAQTSERKPNGPTAVYNIQNMVPDQVSAKPWPRQWYVIPAKPYEYPNWYIYQHVGGKMKVEALPVDFKKARKVIADMDPH